MGLTEYRALLIDCDEVLVDRDSGVWTALQPLLDSRGGHPDKEQVLAEYSEVVRAAQVLPLAGARRPGCRGSRTAV
jgi:hypothetical protein